MYVFPASAYPRIDVKAGAGILWTGARYATGLCDNSLVAGLSILEADMLTGDGYTRLGLSFRQGVTSTNYLRGRGRISAVAAAVVASVPVERKEWQE